MIMIDTKEPMNPPSELKQYLCNSRRILTFCNTHMCTEKNALYVYTALFEHWFMKFGIPEELRSDSGSEYIKTK